MERGARPGPAPARRLREPYAASRSRRYRRSPDGERTVKLRWQLVVSHLVSILTAALLIGAVHLFLLLRSTRVLEQQSLDASLATASHLLSQKMSELEGDRDAMAAFVASTSFTPDVEQLGRLHDLLALYRVERVEVFDGLRREAEAYRWERGIGSSLETPWFPRNPNIAAKIAAGRNATWVHRGTDGRASLKLATPLHSAAPGEHRWLVVSEPLDGTLLGEIVPAQASGALEAGGQTLAVWPETPGSHQPDLASLAAYLPRGTFSFLFKPLLAVRPTLQLDDGTVVSVELMTSAVRSGESLLVGLQAWFVVLAGGMLLAFTLGNSLANRLLAPLSALLDGTAAMARGRDQPLRPRALRRLRLRQGFARRSDPARVPDHPRGRRLRCDDDGPAVLERTPARGRGLRAARRGRPPVRPRCRRGPGGGDHDAGTAQVRGPVVGERPVPRDPVRAGRRLQLGWLSSAGRPRIASSFCLPTASRSGVLASMTRRRNGSVFDGRTLNHQSAYCTVMPSM